MAEIIECPQCRRKLRLDDAVIGQTVQCPSCQETFTAERPAPPVYRPSPTPERERPRPSYRDDAPPRRPTEDDEDYPRRSFEFDDHEHKRPHRGTTIQVLGILGLVFFWMPLVCLILSISALTMANEDLRLMQRGHMDRSGQGATTAGRTCAIISLVLMPCTILCCCMSRMR